MPLIEVDYEFKLPNEYMVDHGQDQGKTRTATYDGPDKLYLIVDNETGKEAMGPITAEEKADGRPVPQGCRYVEIDCVENPLLCQLRGPVIDEAEEDYTEEVFHPQSPEIAGYDRLSYQLPLQPSDIYDKHNITVNQDNTIDIPVRSVTDVFLGEDVGDLPDWNFVRKHRDMMLKNSDSELADDMPESLKAEWRAYRQLLRDLPTVMQANSVPPYVAMFMFPEVPFSTPPE